MTRPWDAARIAELRALVAAAAPGPWFAVGTPWGDGTTVNAGQEDPHGGAGVCDCDPHGLAEEEEAYRCEDDAAFIAAARTDLPEALDEIERLRALRCDCDEEAPGGHRPDCALELPGLVSAMEAELERLRAELHRWRTETTAHPLPIIDCQCGACAVLRRHQRELLATPPAVRR